MCGRYNGVAESDFQAFGLTAPKGYRRSFNVAPGSLYPVLFRQSPLQAERMKWGLIPHWSKTPNVAYSTINARAENLTKSPVFRDAFSHHRCLIPVRGFYEWRKNTDGSKTPFYIYLKSRTMFSFAGIWDTWNDVEGKTVKSYAIVTTAANEAMTTIHARMPVILPRNSEDIWTDIRTPIETLKGLLMPYASEDIQIYEISSRVNNTAHDDADILTRV